MSRSGGVAAVDLGRDQGPAIDFKRALMIEDLERMALAERQPALKILIIGDCDHANQNVRDDINQFGQFSRHYYARLNPMKPIRVRSSYGLFWHHSIDRTDFSMFDAIVVHFSIYTIKKDYLPDYLTRKIREFPGVKIMTIRDEYRFIDQIADKIGELGIDLLLSVLRPHHIEQVYHHPKIRHVIKIGTLPGLAPADFVSRSVPAIKDRDLHITYRSRPLLPIVGTFGLRKYHLGVRLKELAPGLGLKADVSTRDEDRVYGDGWIKLQTAGKAVLSAAGGSGLFDFTGDAHRAYLAYKNAHPDATASEIIERALRPYDGNIVHSQITPRTFEAIALRTALVMPEEDYRGIVEPWRHYIPVQGDWDNAEDIARHLKDDEFLQELADRTFNEIILERDYSRKAFVAKFDAMLDRVVPEIARRRQQQGRPVVAPSQTSRLAAHAEPASIRNEGGNRPGPKALGPSGAAQVFLDRDGFAAAKNQGLRRFNRQYARLRRQAMLSSILSDPIDLESTLHSSERSKLQYERFIKQYARERRRAMLSTLLGPAAGEIGRYVYRKIGRAPRRIAQIKSIAVYHAKRAVLIHVFRREDV